jgi:hypothetical protein
MPGYKPVSVFKAFIFFVVLLTATLLTGQDSGTGNLSGSITGARGASISGATVTLTNRVTGVSSNTVSSPAGTYAIRDLPPGDYLLHVEAKSFQPAELFIRIQPGSSATGDVRLQRLPPSEAVLVNQSPEVRQTVDAALIEQLPSDHNTIELARIAPSVQVFDAQALSPTKSGIVAASIGGRNGRTTRITVDGIDISDEVVGSSTQNVSQSSTQEMRVTQSFAPLSAGLAAAGVVNLNTRSGGDALHGDFFGNFRNQGVGIAQLPGGSDNPFSREVFGGGVGGAIKPGKLFGFIGGDYFKQDYQAPVIFNAPFSALNASYSSPFRQAEIDGRLDYVLSARTRMFYRFEYDNSSSISTFGGTNFQTFRSNNNTPSHAFGADFTTGAYTHSVRAAYSRFANHLDSRFNANDPLPGIDLAFSGGSGFASGSSAFAPQRTIQSNREARYDGSRTVAAHALQFGAALNRIDALVFRNLYGSAPQVGLDTNSDSVIFAENNRGITNPLNYPVRSIVLGNGFGCFSNDAAFGSACGGVNDTRIHLYVGDTWKVKSNLQVKLGLQWIRDTGRYDSDLALIPCSAASGFGALAPCSGTGNLLDHFGTVPALGSRIRQPNLNLAPQFGFAWDPGKAGRSVLRAGIGLYYDNNLFQNMLFDRAARQASGQFNAQANDPCASHGVIVFPGNVPQDASGLCGQAIGAVAPAIQALQSAYQAANAAAGSNPDFLGNILSNQRGLLAPNFQSPRSVQMNIGFQHQFGQATLLAVDYVRHVGTHYLQGIDTNHVGDASRFPTNCLPAGSPAVTPAPCQAALNAINRTLLANPLSQACPQTTIVGTSSQTSVNCYIASVPGAAITDFAQNGLDSGAQYLGGLPASVLGLTPETGAAFSGLNPLVGRSLFFFPSGRSLYSSLQIMLRTHSNASFRGLRGFDFQFAYSHTSFRSNYSNDLGEQDVLPLAADFNHPTGFFGNVPFDRHHQVSFESIIGLPLSGRLAFIGYFASALPQTLFLPSSNQPGEIFRSDPTGDGSFGGVSLNGNGAGDILPGYNIGAYGLTYSSGALNTIINNYNSFFAGQLTPAGTALVTTGLFSSTQLRSLGATLPTLETAPPDYFTPRLFKNFDLRLSWPLRFKDRFTIEPGVTAFNIFNFANYDAPGYRLSGVLNGASGSLNGQQSAGKNRIGLGSGIFSLGSPRQLEFGLKISF